MKINNLLIIIYVLVYDMMDNVLSGKLVKCDAYEAFVPDPLPPAIEWNERLTRCLSDADRLIGQLSGEGKRLPNPHLLIRPFIKREAVLSSRIEGTQTTLAQLLADDAGAHTEQNRQDLREVANYVAAMDYGIERLKTLPLSLRLVREIHDKLMRGVRGDRAAPGEFRRSQNWIGPAGCTLQNASYIPPPTEMLMDCLGRWESFLRDRTLPPLIQAALVHYQFEAIHPFLDGNGRVGRLVIILFLIERQLLSSPFLYLSAFFEATRSEYYDWLSAVTYRSEWNQWLEYFLNGTARMSEDVLSRTARINLLLEKWRNMISGSAPRILPDLIDLLAENPYWTAKGIAGRLNVAFTTAQRAIRVLQEYGVLVAQGQAKRDRVFCARQIMDILDEPAKIEA